jgi:hypothetical protein
MKILNFPPNSASTEKPVLGPFTNPHGNPIEPFSCVYLASGVWYSEAARELRRNQPRPPRRREAIGDGVS